MIKDIPEPKMWESYGINMRRMKVDGGYLYENFNSDTMCFVPDVDLQRYQAHLRDAYKQGYECGWSEAKLQYSNSNLVSIDKE